MYNRLDLQYLVWFRYWKNDRAKTNTLRSLDNKAYYDIRHIWKNGYRNNHYCNYAFTNKYLGVKHYLPYLPFSFFLNFRYKCYHCSLDLEYFKDKCLMKNSKLSFQQLEENSEIVTFLQSQRKMDDWCNYYTRQLARYVFCVAFASLENGHVGYATSPTTYQWRTSRAFKQID